MSKNNFTHNFLKLFLNILTTLPHKFSYVLQCSVIKKLIIEITDIKASSKIIKMGHDRALLVMFLGVPPISGSRTKKIDGKFLNYMFLTRRSSTIH